MRDPFIGVGPGRCGSNSLAHIVAACKNTEITHEKHVSQWYRHDPILEKLIAKMTRLSESGVLCGEVQCQLLPHFPYLRHEVGSHLKVVCLHRPKEEVVASHMRVILPMLRPFDKAELMENPPKGYRPRVEWYPYIDAADKEQAFEFWWEMYEKLTNDIQEPVFHMQTDEMNDDAAVGRLFDFLEIPESDRVIPEDRNIDPLR